MDTNKVIELGKVSEETRGLNEEMEHPGITTKGPPEG
jgi:hypothetical protein